MSDVDTTYHVVTFRQNGEYDDVKWYTFNLAIMAFTAIVDQYRANCRRIGNQPPMRVYVYKRCGSEYQRQECCYLSATDDITIGDNGSHIE